MTLSNIFSQVLNMSMTASLVILGVVITRFALKKAPKVFSYLLWAVVLFRLLSPVSIPSPYSALSFIEATIAQSEGAATSIEYVDTYREVIVKPLPPEVQTERPVQIQPAVKEAPKQTLSLKVIVPWIWLAGAAGMMLFGIVSYLRFRTHLIGAVPIERNVYLVDHIDSAFVAGLILPKIYLPSDIPENEMSYILAHEKYHLHRLDHVTRHMAFIALCLHWFNPLAWVAFILSGKDMEMSCDEAVIQRLGEGIRTEYTASLLRLATSQRIVFGSPLAFGEGDTKERIMNMTKWKKPPKWVKILSMLLCVTVLTACASNPTEQAVVSKNDGSFDANVVQSADEAQIGATEAIQFAESFSSTDGSVEFKLNLNNDVTYTHMPVVEVAPHFYTPEDAKAVATALFGNVEFYETDPRMADASVTLSKQEVQDAIQRWLPYTSPDAWPALFPQWEGNAEAIEEAVQFAKDSVEKYSTMLETLSSDNPHETAQWNFKPDSYYFFTEQQIQEQNVSVSEDNDSLSVTVVRNGIPFTLTFSIRDRVDFKLSNAILEFGHYFSPFDIDWKIWQQKLCATQKPTDEQMRSAQAKAQGMLDQMGIGTWKVDDCYLAVNNDVATTEYSIVVTAVPVFEGVPAIRRTQLSNLKSSSSYASNYYLTDATFAFNANGELLSCSIYSPVDVTNVVNSSTAVMSMTELIDRAKKHLSLSDYENYGLSGEFLDSYEPAVGEELKCEINITEMDYGLIRVKAPNTDDSYYYVPGIVLSGSIDYIGTNSGTVYMSSGTDFYEDRMIPLVAINAVDGTIIALDAL